MYRPLLRFAPVLLVLFATLPLLQGQQPQTPNPNVRFGMPANAKTDPGSREAYLIERAQYVVSYNDKTRTPNWVCWRLKKEDIGVEPKRPPFKPDPLMPKSFTRIETKVYSATGFDRGHMCDAKDRSSSKEDFFATFLLANVVPQSPNSNRKGWKALEDYCRKLVQQGKVLHIASGPAGVGGDHLQPSSLGQAMKFKIGAHAITVVRLGDVPIQEQGDDALPLLRCHPTGCAGEPNLHALPPSQSVP